MKVRTNYSVEEEVKVEFQKLADEIFMNKSKWLENKMKEFINERNKNVKK